MEASDFLRYQYTKNMIDIENNTNPTMTTLIARSCGRLAICNRNPTKQPTKVAMPPIMFRFTIASI